MKEACARVDVVNRLHYHLYQDEGHNSVNLGRYIRDFATETVSAFSENDAIKLSFIELADVELEMDRAISLALIIGELLTNALKYAFDETGAGELAITVSSSEQQIQISLSDNGGGCPKALTLPRPTASG
ncbi:ATP-binding protein [Sphingorhabdus sp.]|uniref:ATP-binding protein n=1 Tax=Sphingorhabdus sp. TaxID=1902408 RepID=UPI003919B001